MAAGNEGRNVSIYQIPCPHTTHSGTRIRVVLGTVFQSSLFKNTSYSWNETQKQSSQKHPRSNTRFFFIRGLVSDLGEGLLFQIVTSVYWKWLEGGENYISSVSLKHTKLLNVYKMQPNKQALVEMPVDKRHLYADIS